MGGGRGHWCVRCRVYWAWLARGVHCCWSWRRRGHWGGRCRSRRRCRCRFRHRPGRHRGWCGRFVGEYGLLREVRVGVALVLILRLALKRLHAGPANCLALRGLLLLRPLLLVALLALGEGALAALQHCCHRLHLTREVLREHLIALVGVLLLRLLRVVSCSGGPARGVLLLPLLLLVVSLLRRGLEADLPDAACVVA